MFTFTRQCRNCGEDFEADTSRRSRKVFCSRACLSSHRKAMVIALGLCSGCKSKPAPEGFKTCAECRADIKAYKRRMGAKPVPSFGSCAVCSKAFTPRRHDHRYCSKTCSNRASNLRCGNIRNPRPTRPCAICGNPMIDPPTNKMYCGRECVLQAHYLRHPRKRVPIDCINCGTSFQPKSNRQKACSVECRNAVKLAGRVKTDDPHDDIVHSIPMTDEQSKHNIKFSDMMRRWKPIPDEFRDHKKSVTIRERYANGTSVRQMVRQLLCVRKGSESDPYALIN